MRDFQATNDDSVVCDVLRSTHLVEYKQTNQSIIPGCRCCNMKVDLESHFLNLHKMSKVFMRCNYSNLYVLNTERGSVGKEKQHQVTKIPKRPSKTGSELRFESINGDLRVLWGFLGNSWKFSPHFFVVTKHKLSMKLQKKKLFLQPLVI